jgi:MOSC domain-containing protein
MWLEAIWHYPVKSMGGERLASAQLGRLGVPGDRMIYVVDERGKTVSARTRASLLGLRGAADAGGMPRVDGERWDSPEAGRLVRAAAGGGARLVPASSFERFDILPLLVITDGAVHEAGLDVRRLRPNLVIGGVEGLAERKWEGRFLGSAVQSSGWRLFATDASSRPTTPTRSSRMWKYCATSGTGSKARLP